MATHHSQEQIEAAVKMISPILKKLNALGLRYPRFEVFEDTSGRLILGKKSDVERADPTILKVASDLVYSTRFDSCWECVDRAIKGEPPDNKHDHEISIRFCCGLVQAAGVH